MESPQITKRRLKGAHNIKQITKAMELVAATKMRKSQEIALLSRPYAFAALELLANIGRAITGTSLHHPLLTARTGTKTALIVITSDKGLAGSFNSSVLKAVDAFLNERPDFETSPDHTCIAIGQKAANYLERRLGRVTHVFTRVGDYTTTEHIRPIAELIIAGYLDGRWDRVLIFSTHFKSALRQEVIDRQILPVDVELIQETAKEIIPETGRFAELLKEHGASFFAHTSTRPTEYLFEPSAESVLADLAHHLVMMQLYHVVLEANASEHAARRMAMKNASDNAGGIIDTLTLEYNKSRQASITRELTELTAGASAL